MTERALDKSAAPDERPTRTADALAVARDLGPLRVQASESGELRCPFCRTTVVRAGVRAAERTYTYMY